LNGRLVIVSNPWPANSFFDSYARNTADMPPMMITLESSLGTAEVEFPGGNRVRYRLFTAPYNSRDCYYFVSEAALGGLPTNRLGIQKLADLGVYCEDWEVTVKNRDDEAFRRAILKAFRDLITVEEVHAL
jgi:hypothetical protein